MELPVINSDRQYPQPCDPAHHLVSDWLMYPWKDLSPARVIQWIGSLHSSWIDCLTAGAFHLRKATAAWIPDITCADRFCINHLDSVWITYQCGHQTYEKERLTDRGLNALDLDLESKGTMLQSLSPTCERHMNDPHLVTLLHIQHVCLPASLWS